MGRLQDALYKAKYGTVQTAEHATAVIESALQKPLSAAALHLKQKLAKEDPEKVKAFLLDLSTSEDMPSEVRAGAKQLYDRMYPE